MVEILPAIYYYMRTFPFFGNYMIHTCKTWNFTKAKYSFFSAKCRDMQVNKNDSLLQWRQNIFSSWKFLTDFPELRFFFFFFSCTGSVYNFLGQGSNLHHGSDKAGSLTRCTTRETLLWFFLMSW